MKIRVAIADDHPLVINGLIQILQCCDDMEVVSMYVNGQELVDGLASLRADVLLLDIHMPYRTGDEVAPIVLNQCKGIRIIALTNQDDTSYVKNMMQCGASGYILKTSGADIIVEAIRSVYRGETYIEASLKERVLQETLHAKRPSSRMPQLTRREQEVLQMIASNSSSQEIADQLFLSKRTIDNHRLSLLLKLDVKNSAALIKKAMQLGLINQ